MFLYPRDQICHYVTRKQSPVKISAKVDFYICLFCQNKYLNENDLESHKKDAHFARIQNRLTKGTNVCRACIKKKKTRVGLLNHIKTFHLLSLCTSQRVNRQIFICDTCYHLFFSKDMLLMHMINAHRFSAKYPIQCPKCIKGVKRKNYLRAHLKMHNILNVSVCHICFTKLNSNEVMDEHVKKCHKTFLKCDNCGFETDRMEHFQIHLDVEHKLPTKFESVVNVPMDVIDRCFAPRRAVDGNINMRYKPVTAITGLDLNGLVNICILCREICTTELEMREHIVKVHIDIPKPDKPSTHTCSCGEIFFNSVLLKHHMFKLKGDHHKVEEPTTSENVGTSESVSTSENSCRDDRPCSASDDDMSDSSVDGTVNLQSTHKKM